MGLLAWLRQQWTPRIRPMDPPPPWDDDLVGEAQLQAIEQRRALLSRSIHTIRAEVDASIRDEIDAIRREHGRGE